MKIKYTLWGIVICTVLGTFLHFAYELSGKNIIVGIFSAINESIWEHLKLLFYPILIFSVFEYFSFAKDIPYFIPSRVKGLLLGLFFIVSAYYTYSGVIGKNYDFINILIFIVSVIITFLSTNIFIKNGCHTKSFSTPAALITVAILIILFTVFTFKPLPINLFADPTGV